jgi:hypothetical protein
MPVSITSFPLELWGVSDPVSEPGFAITVAELSVGLLITVALGLSGEPIVVVAFGEREFAVFPAGIPIGDRSDSRAR